MTLRKHTFLLLFAVIVVICFATLAISWIRVQQEVARAAGCQGHLSQLALALNNYHYEFGAYPPIADEGNKEIAHSWRTLLLRCFEMGQPTNDFRLNEAWDSQHNLEACTRIDSGRIYSCNSHAPVLPGETQVFALAPLCTSEQFVIVECCAQRQLWSCPEDLGDTEHALSEIWANRCHEQVYMMVCRSGGPYSYDRELHKVRSLEELQRLVKQLRGKLTSSRSGQGDPPLTRRS